MLAFNMLMVTIVIAAVIGGGVWYVCIRPLTHKVIVVCEKHDQLKEEEEHYRALAEQELANEFGHKIVPDEPEHINQQQQ